MVALSHTSNGIQLKVVKNVFLIIANADIGITFPYCGIAETATVVQASGEDSGRAISLLPQHILLCCILIQSTPRMTQTMEHLAERYHNGPAKFPTSICVDFWSVPCWRISNW